MDELERAKQNLEGWMASERKRGTPTHILNAAIFEETAKASLESHTGHLVCRQAKNGRWHTGVQTDPERARVVEIHDSFATKEEAYAAAQQVKRRLLAGEESGVRWVLFDGETAEKVGDPFAKLRIEPKDIIDIELAPGSEKHRSIASGLVRLVDECSLHFDSGVERGVWLKDGTWINEFFTRIFLEHPREELMLTGAADLAPFLAATVRWAKAGFPSLDLTLDFFHAMAVTDFGDAGNETMHLPFPEFVIRFPENTVLGGARSAFVFHKPLQFGYLEQAGGTGLARVNRYRAVLGNRDTSPQLGSAIYTEWDADTPLSSFVTALTISEDYDKDIDRATAEKRLVALRRALANTLLYINASGGVPASGKKHKHGAPPEPVERIHAERPQYRVGRPIHLGPQMRAAAESREGSTWRLASRFMVRGHWRNQVHGEGRALRRRQWIQPFWKGPKTLQEALERSYEVE